MTIEAAKLLESLNPTRLSWGSGLDSSSTTPLHLKGAIRWDYNEYFGFRLFQYVRFDQSGGATAGQVQSFRAPVSAGSITAGSTTTATTSGLTANEFVGGFLYITDDAGAAGAAPEGEIAVVSANTTTLITVDSGDAFSAAIANGDTASVILPWAVVDSADGDFSAEVAGVVMADQAQYDWGWVQCLGLHPSVDIVAAGTALPVGESLVAGTALLTDGAGDASDLRVGQLRHAVASDTVLRKAMVDLFCGAALKVSSSTA